MIIRRLILVSDDKNDTIYVYAKLYFFNPKPLTGISQGFLLPKGKYFTLGN